VHRTGVHGGPDPRIVGAVLAVAFVFGSAVLLAEAFGGGGGDDGGHNAGMAAAAIVAGSSISAAGAP
jgi:hypothetical protein